MELECVFCQCVVSISQSFVKSVRNAKFDLLRQTACAMLNTMSQLLTVCRTESKTVGSEYGPDPDLCTCTVASPHISLRQKEALVFPFAEVPDPKLHGLDLFLLCP